MTTNHGPPEIVTEWWRAHHRQVHAYALRRTDRSSAQDVVSETFLVAWRRREAVPEHDPLPWLIGVARNVMANHARSQRRRDALSDRINGEATGAPLVTDPQADQNLAWALGALRPADREVLLLIAWEGLTPAQAAVSLGCSGAAFRVRLMRARRRLRAELEGREDPTAAAAAETWI